MGGAGANHPGTDSTVAGGGSTGGAGTYPRGNTRGYLRGGDARSGKLIYSGADGSNGNDGGDGSIYGAGGGGNYGGGGGAAGGYGAGGGQSGGTSASDMSTVYGQPSGGMALIEWGGTTDLETEVQALGIAITQNTTDITANAADINTNTNNIDENTNSIENLIARVTALEAGGSAGGDGYTILSYLESSGTQYIDIGFKPNNNTEVTIKFQSSQSNASCGIIAVDDGWTTNGYAIFTGYLEFASSYTAHTLTDGIIHTVEIKKAGKYYKDGSLIWTGTNTTFQARYNMTMFCLNRSNVKSDYFVGKIYDCQVYDNGTLIRDFIPAKNSNGVYGMYDRVNDKFYTNAGTGSFTGG
jgi:hypothetical protein